MNLLIARRLALASLVIVATCLIASPALADAGGGAQGINILGLLGAIPTQVIVSLIGALLVATAVPLAFKHLSRANREHVRDVTKGVYYAVTAISKVTPMTLDDQIALVLQKVSDEMDRELSLPEQETVKNHALELHASPDHPDLATPTASELQRAINFPRG